MLSYFASLMNFQELQLPFKQILSFEKIIAIWEQKLIQFPGDKYAQQLLDQVKENPEFITGVEDWSLLEKHQKLIQQLFEPLFPSSLSNNEIKALTLPLTDLYFNPSQRFLNILSNSEKKFELSLPTVDENTMYIISCCLILSKKFNIKINTTYPIYFNLTDNNGIDKYYRILYNSDFIELIPPKDSFDISKSEVARLLNHLDDIDMWKEMFPPNSWTSKGFVIMNLFDATIETAVSNLKQLLISRTTLENLQFHQLTSYLKSIFELTSLEIGISHQVSEEKMLRPINAYVPSWIVPKDKFLPYENSILDKHIQEAKPLIIPNLEFFVQQNPNEIFAKNLLQSRFNSCFLIPLVKNGQFLSLMELSSQIPYSFNSFNYQRIELIYSFLVDSAERSFTEFNNQIQAIIQKRYTSVHPSVYWKFRSEAENYLRQPHENYRFREITFKDVFALYGEVDIKDSTITRNACTSEDLNNQLNLLLKVIDELKQQACIDAQKLIRLKNSIHKRIKKLNTSFDANDEHEIQLFINKKLNPIIFQTQIDNQVDCCCSQYLKQISPNNGLFFRERNKFDQTIKQINDHLYEILDEAQREAQAIIPHYFEFYKTDGIEHSIYVGNSITPQHNFELNHLYQLRFWQLLTICKMVRNHYQNAPQLPIYMNVTSLILIYNLEIGIRFRMDEKRFDVDGTYNARYEMVKKRIDKAYVKNSSERISQAKKLTIVYTSQSDLDEYLNYINQLQAQNWLENEIEYLEVENLQGINGLKAIRIGINLN